MTIAPPGQASDRTADILAFFAEARRRQRRRRLGTAALLLALAGLVAIGLTGGGARHDPARRARPAARPAVIVKPRVPRFTLPAAQVTWVDYSGQLHIGDVATGTQHVVATIRSDAGGWFVAWRPGIFTGLTSAPNARVRADPRLRPRDGQDPAAGPRGTGLRRARWPEPLHHPFRHQAGRGAGRPARRTAGVRSPAGLAAAVLPEQRDGRRRRHRQLGRRQRPQRQDRHLGPAEWPHQAARPGLRDRRRLPAGRRPQQPVRLAVEPARRGRDGPVSITSTATLATLTVHSPLHHGFTEANGTFSPDGRTLAVFVRRARNSAPGWPNHSELALINTRTGLLCGSSRPPGW